MAGALWSLRVLNLPLFMQTKQDAKLMPSCRFNLPWFNPIIQIFDLPSKI